MADTKRVEYWDLFSEETDRIVATIRKGSMMIQPGFYHISVEIIPTDRQGHLLITRRSMTKVLGAGKYEFPAGSALAGETPQVAARRELFEETGLKAARLHKVGEKRIPGMKRFIYVAEIPRLTTAKITLQEGETIDYRIVGYSEWRNLMGRNIFDAERGMFYTTTLYEKVQKLVGESTQRTKPAAEKPLVLRPIDKPTGSRSGVCGQEEYPPELDDDFPKFRSFASTSEDLDEITETTLEGVD